MLLKNTNKKLISVAIALILSGCASSVFDPDKATEAQNVELKKSYLKNSSSDQSKSTDNKTEEELEEFAFDRLNRLSENKQKLTLEVDLSNRFPNTKDYQLSVNELPLNEFLHYALGDILKVSYLIEPSVKSNTSPVTLALQEKVSGRRLFQLVQQVLEQNQVSIALNDDVFYVHPLANKTKANTAFGFGRLESDVPRVSSDIIQLVPIRYGTSTGLRSTISQLVDATVALDPSQGLVTIKGKREQVVRGLSLVRLMDSAGMRNKAIALLNFRYIDSQTFIEKVSELLAEEGIITSGSRTVSSSIKFVPIEHLGKVVVFATADEIIDRVEYWTKQLDKPATGSEQSFFTYHPKYARAADLGESLAPLISGGTLKSSNNNQTSNVNNSAARNNNSSRNNANNANKSVQTIEGENLRLVVDERSNSLIFYSTGKFYQELQPIIKKLDIMPKQVMLEVIIAEVKMTGKFSKGVEYAIKSGSAGSTTESFNFDSEKGFNYSIVGLNGDIKVNLNQQDGLVNVLSRPSILVRDGVSAMISVGDDIPTVGSTTADPINGDRETTTIQYRKTGVELSVTPTINAQGTVIMSIEQNISNITPDGTKISGSPSIFERKLNTEVVAGDGQTVMLGGLISENKNSNATAVPVLGSIPVLGHLFRSDAKNSDKTELVVLVTPKIVNSSDEWERIQKSFLDNLENIKLQ